MSWAEAEVSNADNCRDANCEPLSQIIVSGTSHLANTYFIFIMIGCVVGVLIYAVRDYDIYGVVIDQHSVGKPNHHIDRLASSRHFVTHW